MLFRSTGIVLMLYYHPSTLHAYDDMKELQFVVSNGVFLRNLHRWAAHGMVFMAFAHMLRVFYHKAYKPPREFNWVIGVVLLFLTLLLSFSGYLLPWDQISYWAVTVSTSMLEYVPGIGKGLESLVRGGKDLGPATLLIFYNFHTSILPLTIVILMTFHFWKVRKAGGVVVPGGTSNPDKTFVPVIPNLVAKELAVALVLLAVLFSMSIFVNAPLHDRADPGFSPNPAKAPWYFLGIQELLVHFHPFVGAIFIPLLFVAGLIWFPFANYKTKNTGVCFFPERERS